MKDFENFERGYLLPKGCNDLIDKIDIPTKRKATVRLRPISTPASHPSTGKEDLLLFAPITVSDLASALNQKPFKVIADLMRLGVFATGNQCLGLDAVIKIARRYGYVADELG